MRRIGIVLGLLGVLALVLFPVAWAERSLQPGQAPATVRPYPGAFPCDTTLQACISASADGDSVLVAANTYLTASLTITRAVSLIGGGTNPSDVKLRPTAGRMIKVSAVPLTATFVISNLTVENGNSGGSSGGGIRVDSGAVPVFHSIVVSNNIGAGGGGIRIIPVTPVTMVNVTVFSNTSSTLGGGVSVEGNLTLIDSYIERNSAGTDGGGVHAAGDLTLFNTLAQSNTAASLGGGFFASGGAIFSNTRILSNASDSGGGVYVLGALAITDTTFETNTARVGDGGAIFSANSAVTITLEGTSSVSRTTVGHSFAFLKGGGVFAAGDVLLVGEVLFQANGTNIGGGAIYAANVRDAPGSNNLLAVSFINNAATGGGGAIRTLGLVDLHNIPLFQNNHAGNCCDGGAIYAGSSVFLSRGSSLNNRARNGGAVYAGDIFFDAHGTGPNTAVLDGGCAYSFSSFSPGNVTYNGAGANGCVAGRNGGAAYAAQKVTLAGNGVSTFQNNHAGAGGGVAYGDVVVIDQAQLISNTALEGGAAASLSALTVTDSTFLSNTAATQGGALEGLSSGTLSNSLFAGNQVTGVNGVGGAVWLNGSLSVTNSAFMTNSVFFGAGGQGGALAAAGRLSLQGDTFQGNQANTGGAVRGLADVFAADSKFTGNNAFGSAFGAGIAAITATISSVTFTQNIACCALASGGALSATVANINNSVFIQNTANSIGGAVFAGQVFITGSQFLSNLSTEGGGVWTGGGLITNTQFTANLTGCCPNQGGGAVFAQGQLKVFSSQFTGNEADYGGALVLRGSQSEIHDSTFVDNVVSAGGGAIDAYAFGPFIYNSTFRGNRSGSGGGGAIRAISFLKVEASTFSNNSANSGAGGAIFRSGLSNNITTITASTFISNFAATGGGALFGKQADIENSTFISNHVASFGSGGAVSIFGGSFIVGSSFTDNRVDVPVAACGSGLGGAVYQDTVGSLTVQNSVFTRSSAPHGGAIFAAGGITLELSTFSDNSAVCLDSLFLSNIGAGGAVAARSGLTVRRSSFLRNSAGSVGGGALAFLPVAATNPLRIENSLFARNVAANTVFGARGAALVISGTNQAQVFLSTLANPAPSPVSAIAVYSSTASVIDNIITGFATGIEGQASTTAEDFNLYFGNTTNVSGTVTPGGSSFTANPLFVSPVTDNYHLGLGSPAIDAASNLGITVDFDGDPRPIGAGFDIGFDERSAAALNLYLPLVVK